MAKPDGRVEAGQSLKRAISAQRWNDLCDAADIVHGRRGGVTAGMPAVIDRTVIRAKASSSVRAGYWVFLTPQVGDIDVKDASKTSERAQMFSRPVAYTARSQSFSQDTKPFVGMALDSALNGEYLRVQVSGAIFTFVAMRHRHHGFASFEDPYTANTDAAKIFPIGSGTQTSYIPTSAISGQMRIAWFDDTDYSTPQPSNSTAAICPAIVVL